MPVPVVRSLQEVRITTEGDGKLVMDCAQWFKGGDYIYELVASFRHRRNASN
jgi:hypothetical protein